MRAGIILRYSNGWGHLIVTVTCVVAMTVALLFNKIDLVAVMGILSPIIAFWFISGSANRFNPLNPSAPTPTVPSAPDIRDTPTQPLKAV